MTPSLQPRRLWGPQEVADYLGVPLRTLYAWRTRGQGPAALKIGKHLRWHPEDVASWADAQAGQPEDAA